MRSKLFRPLIRIAHRGSGTRTPLAAELTVSNVQHPRETAAPLVSAYPPENSRLLWRTPGAPVLWCTRRTAGSEPAARRARGGPGPPRPASPPNELGAGRIDDLAKNVRREELPRPLPFRRAEELADELRLLRRT